MRTNLPNFKLALTTIAAAVLVSVVACDKKENNAAPVVPPYGGYGQGCTNCFPNPALAVQGMQSFTGSYTANFTLDLLVSQTTGYPMNWQDPLMLGFYSGPAALQGYMDIQVPTMTFCNIAAGRYSVSTIQAGIMYAKTLSGVRLDMAGPGGRIQATVVTAVLTNQLDMIGTRIAMTLRLDSVNGFMCGTVQTAQY